MGHKIVSLLLTIASISTVLGQSCDSCADASTTYYDAAASSCKPTLLKFLTCPLSANNICDSYDCPKSAPTSFPYDEDKAKNVYWRLQSALNTQTSTPEFTQCGLAVASDIKFINRFNVSCGYPLPTDYCTTDLYVIPSLEQVLAISKGSTGVSQLLQVALSLAAPVWPVLSNGKAVIYFQDAANKVWNSGLSASIKEKLDDNPDFKFVATGHSLGGAMALIIGARVGAEEWRNASRIETHTTGQPRIGNLAYLKSIADYAPNHYRVVNNVDLIPSLPLTATGAHHTNWAVRYVPAMTNAPGNPKTICTWPEQPACADYTVVDSLLNPSHNTYFGIDVTTWYQSGCA